MYYSDAFYIYIENGGEKSIMKLQRDYDWVYSVVEGVCIDLGTLFSHMEIDEIIESLKEDFDVVELIDPSEISDYDVE